MFKASEPININSLKAEHKSSTTLVGSYILIFFLMQPQHVTHNSTTMRIIWGGVFLPN